MTKAEQIIDNHSCEAIEFRLLGDPIDLRELYIVFTETSPKLVEYTDQYFLQVSGFGIDVIQAKRFAEDYLSQLNGAASLIIQCGYQPVRLEANEWYLIDSDGHRSRGTGGVEFISTIYLRPGRFLDEDMQNKLRMRLRTIIFECAGASKNELKQRHILEIISKPKPSWAELYLVQELAWSIMKSRGMPCPSTANIKTFKDTACSWSALGIEARHGNKPDKVDIGPAEAMSYPDALALVRAYVKSLLEHIGDHGT